MTTADQDEEIGFDLFICFLGFLDQGATEEQAWALTAYEQGLITKDEAFHMFGEPNFTGIRRTDVRTWEIPEEPFEKIVYLTAWNAWVEAILPKILHNGVVLERQARKGTKTREEMLVYDFPRDISELALQNQLEEILSIEGGRSRYCYLQKISRNRRAIFALQCLLKIPERKIIRLLDSDSKPRFMIRKASDKKCSLLRDLLSLHGIFISF